jgi:two-component system, sensor histidine kinase and response regulator
LKDFIPILKELAKDRTLLLVEDDEAIMKYLTRLLSKFFLEIHQAQDVEEALKIYKKISTSDISIIVITDINLGEKSGIDLTYSLKNINADQKVIAISGTEDRDIFIESIRCGVDRFVLKPIDINELFNSLVNILQSIKYDLELKKSQKQLEDSKEYALKLLDEQDQFLKNAIHEIHTPLAVIITNVDLMRIQGIKNDSLNSIEAGARIIQNSYEDMTYLMKHDRIPSVKTKINLVDFIGQRINYFDCIAMVNELSFSMRVGHPNLPSIYFSELKLLRLVDNTLSNAIKYSNKPSNISVIIGLQNNNLFFEVRNYGPIINEKEKIFDRFYRESKQKGGYGLGLSIVAHICKEENVDIEMDSTTTRGTSFRYIFNNETNLQHN